MTAREVLRRPAARFVALIALWLASYLVYYLMLVRPYWLYTYLLTPRLSTGVIANREPGPAAAFIAGFLVLFALYALAYRLCRSLNSRAAVVAVGLYGLILAVLLVQVYPIGANDMFGYITAGELLALHGVNPMVHPATAVPGLPLTEYSAYAPIPPNYGPLWTWIEAAVVRAIGRPDLAALVLAFKGVAVAGYAAAGLALVAVLRRRAPDRLAAGLLAFAWNPLVLFEVSVNAHNDIWMGFLVLLGVLFWELRRPVLAVAALTLAPLIKVPVAPLVPLFVAAGLGREPTPSRRRRFFAISALVAAGLVAAFYLSLPEGLKGFLNLQGRSELFTHSLPAVLKLALALLIPEPVARVIVAVATLLAFGLYALRQMWNAWRAPDDAVRLAFNVLLFLLLACMSWFQPWYLLWIITLAACYPRPNAPFQVALFALGTTWTYIVFGFVWFWISSIANWGKSLGIEAMALITTYLLSWEYAVLSAVRKKDRPVLSRAPDTG